MGSGDTRALARPGSLGRSSTAGILWADPDSGRPESYMPRTKKEKKEKKPETTAEFVERMGKQDIKRNGLRLRFGFTKRTR